MRDVLTRYGRKLGCHQRADRSFFYRGHQFPVCARCTGVFIGQVLAIGLRFINRPSLIACTCFCGIMFVDWLIQYLKIHESTNIRRCITGIMCGYGMLNIQIDTVQYLFKILCKLLK